MKDRDRNSWISYGVIIFAAFALAGVSLGITSWSVRGSDDFRYLGSSLGVVAEFSHWEMRWPFHELQAVGLTVVGPNPNGIWVGRWLVWGCILFCIGFLGHVAYGTTAAVCSIILLGFCPLLVVPISQGWIDSMEAGWISLLVALLILLLRNKNSGLNYWLAILFGLAFGFAMLTRITALLILPTAAIVWWWMGAPKRLMLMVVLGVFVVIAIDVVYLYNLIGDGLARWQHLGSLESAHGVSAYDRFAPSPFVRLTYGLPRLLLYDNPLVSAWPTWLLGCASLVAIGFFKDRPSFQKKAGLLVLATLIGVLVLLILPKTDGSFAIRLLPRYFTFIIPLMGVAAVVSVLILAERYPLAKPSALIAMFGVCAFYTGIFLIPERLYSTPLREGMTQALHLAESAHPGLLVVTDSRTAKLLSGIGEIYGWTEVSWVDYAQWSNASSEVDAFIMLDVPNGHNADAVRVREWLSERESYSLTFSDDYRVCSKFQLLSCEPARIAVSAIRNTESGK
ncbi:hypothetical protein M1105_07620 [Limibaculum sp. FT325]|uniref:hypothetical protein n=1 Tax=Thermohalobaculum sediminis TaxID=2939436 RepID=UPI0020C0E0FE|nr:hypothetical protein [Limibaculum sediminis]MCL5776852.1 hypothetical protein [Limibaculum sediminis]